MSHNDQYPTSLVDIQSEQEAEFYMQKMAASFPTKPVDYTLPDQFVAGRQFTPAHQGGGDWHMPAHLLTPEHDIKRHQIDERMVGASVSTTKAPSISSASVWALPGVAPSSWESR
jgi:hypothetical protein